MKYKWLFNYTKKYKLNDPTNPDYTNISDRRGSLPIFKIANITKFVFVLTKLLPFRDYVNKLKDKLSFM